MALENTTPERIEELVLKQRAFFATGTTRDIKWRKQQLKKFILTERIGTRHGHYQKITDNRTCH